MASVLIDIDGDKPAKKKFKAYPIGYFHIDIAQVQTAEGKLQLFVALIGHPNSLSPTSRKAPTSIPPRLS